ncbi:MAG: metallophosphoesterase [Hyphomonadaceae bacterium]|nr:metallophosphoesterase [Hyphomonadaceae bacterium]
MNRFLRFLAALVVAFACFAAPAFARSEWDGVERIVVIGDLEGDYEKFSDMLRTAALIDPAGDWIGGEAHLVQLGDIPDRGPNSRAIIDHLMRLQPQARRAGGFVHALIGNHEAMNVEGDLRYVHPGEYAAFADRRSQRRRSSYFRAVQRHLRQNPPPEGVPVFDEAFRVQWEAEHPLGFVEHRIGWAASGAYGGWVARNNAVIRINDTLFVHGGIGPAYVAVDRDDMNEAVRAALRGAPHPRYPLILTDEDGPLWYRGLSMNAEDAERTHLETLLSAHGVRRVVVGHTKRAPLVLPRFGGRVLITDIATPAGHTDPHAFLLIEGEATIAVHRGQRVPILASTPEQVCAYLAQIAALDPAESPAARLARNCASVSAAVAASAP